MMQPSMDLGMYRNPEAPTSFCAISTGLVYDPLVSVFTTLNVESSCLRKPHGQQHKAKPTQVKMTLHFLECAINQSSTRLMLVWLLHDTL
jgi:hypothetical protein